MWIKKIFIWDLTFGILTQAKANSTPKNDNNPKKRFFIFIKMYNKKVDQLKKIQFFVYDRSIRVIHQSQSCIIKNHLVYDMNHKGVL